MSSQGSIKFIFLSDENGRAEGRVSCGEAGESCKYYHLYKARRDQMHDLPPDDKMAELVFSGIILTDLCTLL